MWTHTSPYGTSRRRSEHWKEALARTEIGRCSPAPFVRAKPIPLIELPVNGGPIPLLFGWSEWPSWHDKTAVASDFGTVACSTLGLVDIGRLLCAQ